MYDESITAFLGIKAGIWCSQRLGLLFAYARAFAACRREKELSGVARKISFAASKTFFLRCYFRGCWMFWAIWVRKAKGAAKHSKLSQVTSRNNVLAQLRCSRRCFCRKQDPKSSQNLLNRLKINNDKIRIWLFMNFLVSHINWQV